ncbi:MAG: hypothetical protein AAF541_20440 [Pseudomonadota bacterium]
MSRFRWFKSKLAQIRADLPRYGLYEIWVRFCLNRVRFFLRVYEVASRPIPNDEPSEASRIQSVTRRLSDDEVRALVKEMPKHYTQAFVDDALARGDICLGAFMQANHDSDEEKLVAFTWRSYSTAPDVDGMWVRVRHHYRYGYKAFTLPEYRGLRVINASASDEYDLSLGKTATIAYVERNNLASLRQRRRKGRPVLGYIIILKLFGRRHIWHSRRVREAGFELYESPTDMY